MTHRFFSSGTPLTNFSANGESHGFQLLIRVVSVNDDGKVILPTRELWGKVNGDADSGTLEFLRNKANSPDDDEEEIIDTLTQANDIIVGGSWLRSLDPQSPFKAADTGYWYVTALVKAEPCIWEKVDREGGGTYYKLHEKNLRTWLKSGRDGAEEFDDEEDWACISCNSDEDSPERDNGDDDDDDDDQDDQDVEEQEEQEEEENGDNNNGDEQPSEPGQDDQALEEDDDEEPSEPVEEDLTSAEVSDDESSKHVDKVQIVDSDDLDDDTEDGGVRLSPDQMKPARRFNFTLVGCEAEATDDGYDGDA